MSVIEERTGEIIHESAHAVSAFVLGLGVKRLRLVEEEGGAAACFTRRPPTPGFVPESETYKHEIHPRALVHLAGPCAEAKARGQPMGIGGPCGLVVLDLLTVLHDLAAALCVFMEFLPDVEELVEGNWNAICRLAAAVDNERDLSREQVATILRDCGLEEGRMPVRLDPPVDGSSSPSELEAWIQELEAFRPAIDHPNDLEVIDWHLELASVWLARRTGRDTDHRSGSPDRRNGRPRPSAPPNPGR